MGVKYEMVLVIVQRQVPHGSGQGQGALVIDPEQRSPRSGSSRYQPRTVNIIQGSSRKGHGTVCTIKGAQGSD